MRMHHVIAVAAVVAAVTGPWAQAQSHRSGSSGGGGRGDSHGGSSGGGHNDWHGDRRGDWHRPVVVYPQTRFMRMPGPCVNIVVSNRPYYYYGGGFYVVDSGGYVIVDAPVGAVVPILPAGCSTVIVGGEAYYIHGHTHFRRVYGGYVVVPGPTTAVSTVPAPVAPAANPSWTVWITNPNGSKTAVVLQAADGGQWIGPRGEYYDSFPTEQQLLPIYGLAGLGETLDTVAQTQAQPAPEQEKTFWFLNRNGSKSKVVLRAGEGGTWIGPRGEVYDTLPTEEQLRPVYGVENVEAADPNAPAPAK